MVHVQHLDAEKFLQAYGVDLQVLYPWEGVVTPPFGAAWAILGPGRSTKSHKHQEGETFFIVRGHGEMSVGGETTPVGPGSVIFQQPFDEHTLTNTSADEDLMFLTVWWEDRELWPSQEDDKPPAPAPRRRVMVTAAPPTPNGDLHLGHLAGPYLSADVYARYLRLRGGESYYACGTDDHCMYVERMGQSLGMSGHEAADFFSAQIRDTLAAAGVAMDVFMNPRTSPYFKPLVLDFFHRLYRRGKLEERRAPAPYCEPCGRYLHEADVAGGCPHCGAAVTGNTCEDCGRINDCIDLKEPRCTACGTPAGSRPFTRLIFPLSHYAEELRRYHRSVTMNAHLRAFCERAIADGLPDVAISHVSSWGIPVPMAGGDGEAPSDPAYAEQTLYVWFEMAARYFAYAQHLSSGDGTEGSYESFWRSPEAEIVQFFGFDNSFYYAILLPALYLAYDRELRLPTAFVTNEFYRLDGEKFSTSRDHRILGRTMAEAVPRDVMRFFLAYSCPEREETNFTVADFEETVERELRRDLQAWLADLGRKVRDEFDATVPATGDWTDEQRYFYRRLERFVAEAAEAYAPATFSPQRAARLLCELVRSARRFGKGEDHWRGVPERSQERRTAVALELLAVKVLAILAAPIMPELAGRLWRDLGCSGSVERGTWEDVPAWVEAGQRIGELGRDVYIPGVRGRLDAVLAQGKDRLQAPGEGAGVINDSATGGSIPIRR